MWPTWVLSAPGGSHVGPMNLAFWAMVQMGHKHYKVELEWHCWNDNSKIHTIYKISHNTIPDIQLCTHLIYYYIYSKCRGLRGLCCVCMHSFYYMNAINKKFNTRKFYVSFGLLHLPNSLGYSFLRQTWRGSNHNNRKYISKPLYMIFDLFSMHDWYVWLDKLYAVNNQKKIRKGLMSLYRSMEP